jgi:hypothetical protein
MNAISGIVGALALNVIASTSTLAQPARSAGGRIDGSSGANFEASVAALLSALPTGRREDLGVALAVIWMSNTLGPSGLDRDGDGDVDTTDARLLAEDTHRLLADIERGDLLASIEKREQKYGSYTVADYVKRLDGLGYEEVLDLAGRPGKVSLPSLRRSRPLDSTIIDAKTAKTINEAIEAMNMRLFADARRAIEKLDASRLSPYERSKVEQILFVISYNEGELVEAREHLRAAVSAGGLNGQEVTTALVQIRFVESRFAASPVLLPMPKFP